MKEAVEVWDLISPERVSLIKLKKVAVRNGIWHRVLSWDERRYVDALTMAHIGRIRSSLVLRVLALMVKKLLDAVGRRVRAPLHIVCGDALNEEAVKGALCLMDETAYRMMRSVAKEISRIAHRWGNKLAHKWPEDAGFLKYLLMMSLPQNKNPPTFTVHAP